jgi:pyruvate dehydrogenase E2 component (dihydrolipoamide acetyltransferase)
MGNLIDVQVPDLGDFKGVPVIELLVKDGDTVEKDQALLVLESDKSTMEVPSPGSGIVRGFKVKLGDKLSKGDRICRLENSEAGGVRSEAAPVESQEMNATTAAPPTAEPSPNLTPHPSPLTVTIPDIGDYKNVPVIELLVKEGDAISKEAPLLVLESEKSTMEVPAPQAGTVRSLRLKVGDKVSKDDVVCVLETVGTVSAPAPTAPAAPAPAAEKPASATPTPAMTAAAPAVPATTPAPISGSVPHAGPATRKFARELGVDLALVQGSGAKGRIVVEDVQKFIKQRMTAPAAAPAAATGAGIPPIPAQDFSLYGEIEQKPLARIRKLSAAYLHRSWLNVPHVTQNDEADITELEAFRKSASDEGGVKLTLLPFVMKAVSVAIRQYPEFGSSLSPDGGSLIMKKYCHVGFAADTPNGLVVPVVRDVWNKSITQLAQETAELAKKARDGKLKPDEMKGGCFSISSLGGIGGSHFTPIVNAPEVGILGVSRGVMKPVWDGKAFQPRLMLPLSLSYDHRVIDGAYAARFIVALVKLLGDLRRLSL